MQVGDIVIAGNKSYRVTGIYLGGVGTENLVGLKSLTLNKGYAGRLIDEMFVPESLVLAAELYRRVN